MSAEKSSHQYVTVAEIARATRLSKMTIYRLLHAGTLPSVRIGRSFRIPRSTLEAFLSESTTAAADTNTDADTDTDTETANTPTLPIPRPGTTIPLLPPPQPPTGPGHLD